MISDEKLTRFARSDLWVDSLDRIIGEMATELLQRREQDRWIRDNGMLVIKDGNAWSYVLVDFKNLQESPSVWLEIDSKQLDKIYKELMHSTQEVNDDK